jgi:hypothetical protein
MRLSTNVVLFIMVWKSIFEDFRKYSTVPSLGGMMILELNILPLHAPTKRFRFERHIKTLSQRRGKESILCLIYSSSSRGG